MKSPIQRQMELFSAALEHPAGPERDAFLAKACAGDDALLECVRTLLAGHSQAGSFLAQPAGPVGPTGTHLLPATERPGDKIGRYKLLQQIGEGGCGTVYMAEQEEPVRRRVALKVIRLGMDTKSVIARFEAERQALALMDHPNIAKVFDGGATESGRPYFVMELVRGIKITEYCDLAHLSSGERLKLFIQVCQAVQHAHQKGIIHRDIKPSNILVTVNDGVAVPKVIDFGIAKATDQRLTDKTYFTEFHAFIGTPAYTSPEQAEMSSLDIDTRSDIYSLGVLLYEMLTGQTPFPAERLLQSGLDEMRRIIREEEPPRPSTRLTTLGLAEATELSQKRQAKIPQLASAVQGDLDWIVMKALEKDRTRRYATSLDFAADLQRHLDNEPVHAGAPSNLYKFQKLVRRNKGTFAAAAAVFLTLLTGLGLTAWQAVRASRAELAARAQSDQARTDRDRAVLAESNATEKATVATNALLTANERMVKLNVAEGWRRVEEGDHFGALLPFAEAFALEQDKPDRAEIHQMRLASVLQRSPKLVNVWSVGTNITLEHAEFSRDGSKLFATSRTPDRYYTAQIWNSTTGQPLIPPIRDFQHIASADWTTDETRIVTGSDDGKRSAAQVWSTITGQPVGEHILDAGTRVRFSRDGMRLLTFCTRVGTMKMWDAQSRQLIWSTRIANTKGILTMPILLSPSADRVMTGRAIIDGRTGAVLREGYSGSSPPRDFDSFTHDANLIHAAKYSPDGHRLFFCHDDAGGDIGWATLRDGRDVERVIKRWPKEAVPYLVRFSADGSIFASANVDSTVRIWSSHDGSPLISPIEHRGLISDVRFSSDGRWLATGMGKWADDGYAQVWDAESGKLITPRLPHDGPVLRVAFNKDNTQLFVVGESGTVAVWSLASLDAPRFTWCVPELWKFNGIKLSPDGKLLTTKSGSLTDRNWWRPGVFQLGTVVSTQARNLMSGELLLPPLLMTSAITPMSADRIVESEWKGWSEISMKDGSKVRKSVASYFNTTNEIHVGASFVRTSGAPLPGGWMVAHQEKNSQFLVVEATNGTVIAHLNYGGLLSGFERVEVRPDGKQVVAADSAGRVARWNLGGSNTGEILKTDGWLPSWYSGSGRLLVMSHDSKPGLSVFDTTSFEEVLGNEWIAERASVDDAWILALHASGDRWQIHSAKDSTIKSAPLKHRGSINCGDFTADDTVAMTAGSDSMVRFWRVPDAERAALPLTLPSEAMDMWTTADGRGVVTGHADDTLRFWELPKAKRPVSDWLALARFFANGGGTGPGGTGDSPVSPRSSFHDEWQALRAKHPEVFTVSADEIDAWHRHEAWRCESTKDWSNAVHHLTELLKTHPDSGDFLPRRAAAYVAMASNFVASGVSRITSQAGAPQEEDQIRLTPDATNLLERALADYNRTLAWVDRFPAIAKESRLPFVEKRREVYLKLGRKAEADADERELKAVGK